jgi:hypothetical protein
MLREYDVIALKSYRPSAAPAVWCWWAGRHATGWVGIKWSQHNSPINEADSADRPDPLVFFAHQY